MWKTVADWLTLSVTVVVCSIVCAGIVTAGALGVASMIVNLTKSC